MYSKILIFSLSFLLLIGCLNKSLKNIDINVTTFVDYDYPCVFIDFKDNIVYLGKETSNENGVRNTIYKFKIPSKSYYNISLVKRQVIEEGAGWYLGSIKDQYPEELIIYSEDDEDSVEGSSIVIISEQDGDIFLRSIVSRNIDYDNIYLIIIDRLIGYGDSKGFSILNWKNSDISKKHIEDSIEMLKIIRDNSHTSDCRVIMRSDKGVK